MIGLRLYSPLQIDVIDPNHMLEGWTEGSYPAIPLRAMGPKRVAACNEQVLSAIRKLQPQEEARSIFCQYTDACEGVCGKVVSISHTVEQIGARLYGVAVCKSREALSPDDIHAVKYHCREQYGEGWAEGYTCCLGETPDQKLYIHFWQDESDRLLTKAELDTAMEAGQITDQAVVQEIDKDTFWTLIEAAKRCWGRDLDCSAKWLEDQLLMMGPQQSGKFHDILQGYLELSNQFGLRNAAILMMKGDRGDVGFADFRAWLIAQGRDVYLGALKDPDSLADVPAYGGFRFERLYYAAERVYEQQTGQSIYSRQEQPGQEALAAALRQDIQYGEGIGYPYEWAEMADYLPRLTAQYSAPARLRAHGRRCYLWDPDDPGIQKARKIEPKSRKVKQDRRRSR